MFKLIPNKSFDYHYGSMSEKPITLRLQATNQADIVYAANLLQQGKLVAFPTETVYGLGANALSAEAVARIFVAKQRPSWDPLIVHIASVDQLAQITEIPTDLTSRISQLTSTFWPGPLTLLLPRSTAIPDAVTAGRPLVGVRIPAHPVARILLEAAAVPVAAPSANLFGHTSPTTAAHVLADLDGRIDAVLDAGPTTLGLESTVIDPTQTPMVLYRPGAITPEQLTAATGIAVHIYQPGPAISTPESRPAPGVGIRHYAPHANLILIEPNLLDLEKTLLIENDEYDNVGVMLPEGWTQPPRARVFAWGNWNDPETLAPRLFAGLRDLDSQGVATILCPLPPSGGIGDALRDRLKKAAIAV